MMSRALHCHWLTGLCLLAATACNAGTAESIAVSEARMDAPSASSAESDTAPLALVAIDPMPSPRAAHTATRLRDGRVLIAGGCIADGCEAGIAGDAIVLHPETAGFSPAVNPVGPRVGHSPTAPPADSALLPG